MTFGDYEELFQATDADVEVSGLTVSHQEIQDLNSAVLELDTDVRAHEGPPMFETPSSTLPSEAFLSWRAFRNGKWQVFKTRWDGWFKTHQTVLSQTGDSVAAEFEGQRAEYNELRRQFIETYAGKTGASQVSSGGGTGFFGELPWGAIVLAAVVVVGGYWLVVGGGAVALFNAFDRDAESHG